MKDNFEIVTRKHGDCWLHNGGSHWVVFYESLDEARKPPFAVYKAIEGHYGQDPWTVNNRRLGYFKTLAEAKQYIDNTVKQER